MRLSPQFASLDDVLESFGLKPVPFQLHNNVRLPPPGTRNYIEETIFDLDTLQHGDDGTWKRNDASVFLYIDRVKSNHDSIEDAAADINRLPRFHLMDCHTLRGKRADGTFERYVVTDRFEGPFKLTIVPKGQVASETVASLKVCWNCVMAINWKGMRTNDSQRRRIVEDFSREEFLRTYDTSFASRPSRNAATENLVDYPAEWPFISRRFREARGFKCEAPDCGVNCKDRPQLTDAHHINHDVTDCRPENLQVLCKLCHEKRHKGWYRASDRERRDIFELRRQQGIPSNAD